MKERLMASETIVAIFDTAADAGAAVADLRDAGFPENAIEQHSKDSVYDADARETPVTGEAHKHSGFWAWLTGEGTDETHHALYDRSVTNGSTVVTVITDETRADDVSAILESHSPVDLQERHDHYGLGAAPAAGMTTDGGYTDALGTSTATPAPLTAVDVDRAGTHEDVIALSEEALDIGKRQIDRGTTRVRRYVVERPVEEQINLRSESVSVFRRPVSGAAAPGAFTDKVVEVTETAEEVMVVKTAHVVEEVVIAKTVEDHTETVRDTVRRDEVEIEGPQGRALATDTTPAR
jgi:uncharacterized protein (TIGR02271 family)